MRKTINLTLLISLLILIMSFYSSKNDNPPGTIKIKEGFYVDQVEISNLAWREFMYWTKRNYGGKSKEYNEILPDTTVWAGEKLTENQINYLRHPIFQYYPVVGISYEQAVLFCEWRSDAVNLAIWLKEKKLKYDEYIKSKDKNTDIPKYCEYRLPSKEELIDLLKNENIKLIDEKNSTSKHLTYSYEKKEENCIYGINTNVSEMTLEKGIAIGGNWKIGNNSSEVKYDKASHFIGFRCVCEKKLE